MDRNNKTIFSKKNGAQYWAKVVQILGHFLEFESLDFSSFAYYDTPECNGGHYAKKTFLPFRPPFLQQPSIKRLSEKISMKSFLNSWEFKG